eukprot:8053336-Alexandrium_andersonii.AAC.1
MRRHHSFAAKLRSGRSKLKELARAARARYCPASQGERAAAAEPSAGLLLLPGKVTARAPPGAPSASRRSCSACLGSASYR